jgi:hypothetical protein
MILFDASIYMMCLNMSSNFSNSKQERIMLATAMMHDYVETLEEQLRSATEEEALMLFFKFERKMQKQFEIAIPSDKLVTCQGETKSGMRCCRRSKYPYCGIHYPEVIAAASVAASAPAKKSEEKETHDND